MKNRQLMQKVMKGLLEVVFSVKLYSQRCEYLEKKYGSRLKMDVFGFWFEQMKEKKERCEEMKRRAKITVAPFSSFLMRFAFRQIKEDTEAVLEKEEELFDALVRCQVKKTIRKMKERQTVK